MSAVADTFRQAASQCLQDPRRRGNVVHLEAGCEVIVTGDLHGNRAALAKVIRYADLPKAPQRRLVLQELVHGPLDAAGQDRSIDLLLRAVRLLLAQGPQVLFLLGNHDLAQATGNEITKEGHGVCKAFAASVQAAFGAEGAEVLRAVNEFLLALPLAIRCPNGVFLAHSIPSPARLQLVGEEVLDRPCRPEDLRRGGGVYEWTWGRGQTPQQLDELAGRLSVQFFLLGHRHTPEGFEMLSPRCAALASDNDHGCLVQFDADQPVTNENITGLIKPLASL